MGWRFVNTPPMEVRRGLPGEPEDAQRRFIEATYDIEGFGPVTVMNGYFPQGENRDHPTKFPIKPTFISGLIGIWTMRSHEAPLVVMGDMNIAPWTQTLVLGRTIKTVVTGWENEFLARGARVACLYSGQRVNR